MDTELCVGCHDHRLNKSTTLFIFISLCIIVIYIDLIQTFIFHFISLGAVFLYFLSYFILIKPIFISYSVF